jgi:hypothetical protein
MKSIWDQIFSESNQELTPEQQQQALDELVIAVTVVMKRQATPEHGRIAKLIQEKMEAEKPSA